MTLAQQYQKLTHGRWEFIKKYAMLESKRFENVLGWDCKSIIFIDGSIWGYSGNDTIHYCTCYDL